MDKYKIIIICFCFFLAGNISAAEHQVKMLSSLKGQMMVFDPPVLTIQPGDTVRWLATNPGHNTASIDDMVPTGGPTWNGQMNEEVVVTFNKEGVYGYKCTPHYILGMVGLIVVGDKSSNMDKSFKRAEEIQEKFATNKSRFTDYFSQIK
jgi:pseudoazurin